MVTVIGLGFVGLTTALGFAEMGHRVYGVETDNLKMEIISSGQLPFLEPGLDEALRRHLGFNFIPTTDIETAIQNSDFVYYCVGTPYGQDGQADLTYLFHALDQTLHAIKDDKFRVLVTKSTIPPSTTERRIIPFLQEHVSFKQGKFGVANNPEFLREGYCWNDFINADRIIIGVEDSQVEFMLRTLYSSLQVPVMSVSFTTSEFIKYLSNTLLATMISYSNEMSLIADAIGGVDIAQSFKILHMDKRWAGSQITSYIYPGCGYGGYCLPKDTNALYAVSTAFGFIPQILEHVIKTNDYMPNVIVDRIERVTKNKVSKIGILGLSFKPQSDDVRDSPSAKIIAALNERGYSHILGYDPVANKEFAEKYDFSIQLMDTHEEIMDVADVVVIVTAWEEFKSVIRNTEKPVIDCRYMQ